MQRFLITFTVCLPLVFWSCSSAPEPQPASPESVEDISPPSSPAIPTSESEPEFQETLYTEPPYQQGLMNEYDVYRFLKEQPSEKEIVQTLGQPDSVWVDEFQTVRIYYYYVPRIRDYNSVEINVKSRKAIGFEWD